jgi:hypothetical protein
LEQIAEVINQPKDKVEKAIKEIILIFLIMVFQIFHFKLRIDNKLGGNYQFVYIISGIKPACSKEIL